MISNRNPANPRLRESASSAVGRRERGLLGKSNAIHRLNNALRHGPTTVPRIIDDLQGATSPSLVQPPRCLNRAADIVTSMEKKSGNIVE